MTFKKKRLAKLVDKIIITVMIILVITYVAFLIMNIDRLYDDNNKILIVTLIAFAIAVILYVSSIVFGEIRLMYLRKIKQYREYRHFNFILDYIEQKEYRKAIDLYNSLPQGDNKVFLNGYLIAAIIDSDSDEKELAIKRLNELRESINHYNVQF